MLRYLIFLWHVMLRCMILSYAWCSATWSFCNTSCYAAWSCLVSDTPLLDLSVTCMLRCMILSYAWCSATWSFCDMHATLHDLVLCLMLRYLIFLWHVMLRCMILSYVWCSATWSFCDTSCYAAWGCLMSDAPLLNLSVTRHATLHDLVLCLMLRYLIFLWHVMLRCMILSYVWCSATWSFCDAKPTYPVDHLSSEPKRIEWIDLDICENLAVALGDSTCWICSVEKNRQSLVQDGQVTVCECWNWGFGEKKLAARPIFQWEIW